MNDRLIKVLHGVFEVEAGALEPRLAIRDLPGWDSLKHLKLIMAVEMEFGIELEPEQIEGLKNIGDIELLSKSEETG